MTWLLTWQAVGALRAEVALGGAGALQRAGWLDAAQNILDAFSASADPSAAALTAEANLRLQLAQVRDFCARSHPAPSSVPSRACLAHASL